MFGEDIKFKYDWRPYQKRVLDNADKYLNDGKINIVAAPGSGKTVLGLELVRRLNKPVLILAPTITIKNQWVDRFVSLFTNYKEIPEYISTDIYNLKQFNVITYQALHFAFKNKVRNNNDTDSEETDDIIIEQEEKISPDLIKEYNLIDSIKKNNIATIVLDEAHHLRTQWWTSLNQVVNSIDNSKIISLTATPPYDEEYNEFRKYIDLCGEIDETISIPELVEKDNLCPHQDYIYFNSLNDEEKLSVKTYEESLNLEIERLKNSQDFRDAIANHKYILYPYQNEEELLDNVEYYSAMLIFLKSQGVSIKKENVEIIGAKTKIPEFNLEYLEILLNNVIFNLSGLNSPRLASFVSATIT